MIDAFAPNSLVLPMFSSAAMRAIVDDRARLQRMLDFEAALARAEGAVGVIPHAAVDPIVAAAKTEQLDLPAIAARVWSGSVRMDDRAGDPDGSGRLGSRGRDRRPSRRRRPER